jgi:hypothetical protein
MFSLALSFLGIFDVLPFQGLLLGPFFFKLLSFGARLFAGKG